MPPRLELQVFQGKSWRLAQGTGTSSEVCYQVIMNGISIAGTGTALLISTDVGSEIRFTGDFETHKDEIARNLVKVKSFN